MLNYFPILFLAPLAYFLLRVCVAIILIHLGRTNIKHRSSLNPDISPSRAVLVTLGIIEIVIGILFFVGFSTQIVALILMIISVLHLLRLQVLIHARTPSRIFFFLLFFVALSLFITGAGPFAYDLPI